ncbi:peroxisomal N(1)-acetyl-spermine/spermidine oxidase isoform X3 [Wyeomyia smithii]|uniref:peroxisomal N(1)-acetyl-spermine/spermidine oxidase isoform X1 n=1 Tax=Wyeomyia smithii TaxID=174621 RepID=UPI00246819D3|nr:peroxisomal N(1)-acetyl-spermine/spermidine oxidase isoform X1 [Wyeomyia smithii]XP_055544176.1 peroxisomal N(1)-acetyl-spermine/spermidine oxidase isoform X2 [Wyeomyia smithii]XP_055544177.1 peroxisomal N(1)-acetyl-spermine/spermidine oxidase isoform X3 [Wyeomyia smithii]
MADESAQSSGEDTACGKQIQQQQKRKCKVLIIGAGMAGLSSANHLVKNGCTDFVILEARNRVGGRIIGIELGSQKIELGANWIHGVLGNPMFELAMQHGLISIINVPKPHKVVAATEDGKQVPFQVLQEIYEAYVCFLRRCEEYFLCQYLPPPDVHSVGEHINLEAALYLNNIDDQKEKHLRKLIFECLLKRETCITGCHSMDEIDLLELGSYTELQGGNIVLPSGYSSILKPLCDTLPKENIILACPVKTIHWKRKSSVSTSNNPDAILEEDEDDIDSDDSDKTVTEVPIDGATGSSDTSTNDSLKHCTSNVQVVCDNGTIYEADHVICTIPLGVLKDHGQTMFSPSLPQYKLESIDSLLYGTVDKIFLEYDRPFLSAKISEIMFLWEHADPEPDVDEEEFIKANWFKKIYSFSKISDTLLLGWISGREAAYMESISHEIIAEKCTEILRRFLKDPFIPKPKRCVCTSWEKQPYSRGSYTAIAVGASQDDIENIAQPLYSSPHQAKPSVLFAGEHTHSNFYSTVHGAYLSGRTAAQILLTPDSPQEIVMESDTSDLSSWIQGIALE